MIPPAAAETEHKGLADSEEMIAGGLEFFLGHLQYFFNFAT